MAEMWLLASPSIAFFLLYRIILWLKALLKVEEMGDFQEQWYCHVCI